MNILVCVSCVPDTTTRVRFTGGNTVLDKSGIQWIINPWDELALTRALQLRESGGSPVERISVISVDTAEADPVLRKALAIGADDACRIDSEPLDAFHVAAQIAGFVRKNPFDIVLCGIESSDYNGSAVGGMLSEMLEMTSVSAMSSLSFEGGDIRITREIDGGKEQLSVAAPFIGIVQKGIATEPRIPSMRGIMMARKKNLEVLPPVEANVRTSIMEFEMPPAKQPCRMVDPENIRELVDLLQNEAKVL